MDAETKRLWDSMRKQTPSEVSAACHAPFVSMFLTATGDVVACCESQAHSLGNIAHQRLAEIWNGPRYRQLRSALAAYQLPNACSHCAWQMAAGDWQGITAQHFDGYAVESDGPPFPRVMEFAISNACNLECIMCNGESSSLIRRNREKKPALPRVYDEVFFEDLREFLPHLQTAKFLGGEPFLIKGMHRIWEMLIEDHLTPACVVTTNGTRYDGKIERVLERLPMSIMFSMDGATQGTLEAIRLNAQFEVLVQNIRRFVDYTRSQGTTFRFIYSLMRENWHELGEFMLMAESLGVGVNLSPVVEPKAHSLYSLPPNELSRVAQRLEVTSDPIAQQLTINRATWLNAVATITSHAENAHLRSAAESASSGANALAEARVLEHQGDLEAAIALTRSVSRGDGMSYQARVDTARISRALGQLAEAEDCLALAIEDHPDRPDAYLERAWLRREQGRLDEGIDDAHRALRGVESGQNPSLRVPILGVAGLLLSDAKRFDEAHAAFTRLFEVAPANPQAYTWRGWAWISAGDLQRARADATAALALDPDFELAKELLRAVD